MNKISVIFTGGTIGSIASDGDISPSSTTKSLLLNKYAQKYNKDLSRFIDTSPISILSENANVADIIKMYKEILNASKQDVKGIIMTHGSDTLAYSGAYLSILSYNIKKPIVLVASNFVLTNELANGIDNFACAVDLIDDVNCKSGVYVAYKNPQDSFVSVHLACRMCEPAPYSDSFLSPVGYRYATWKNGKLNYENTSFEVSNQNFDFNGTFKNSALVINPFTGLDYNNYKQGGFNYVLHNLYHSGTANTQNFANESMDTNFLNFADYCNKNKIPLYICNIKKKDENYNSTNQILTKNNVKILYDILPNIALAKLNIGYNLLPKEMLENFLFTNICGEMIKDKQYI